MIARQYVGYGIVVTVVGGLILLLLVGIFDTVTEWAIPWEVWVFVPVFALVFGGMGLMLIRQLRLEAAATRMEGLAAAVRSLQKDVNSVDAQHTELIDTVPERLNRLDERIQELWHETQKMRVQTHRTAVGMIVDRLTAERGWSRRQTLEGPRSDVPTRIDRAVDTNGGLVLIEAFNASYGMGNTLELGQNYLEQIRKSENAVIALLVFPNETDVASGKWGGPGNVRRVSLEELECTLRSHATTR